MIAQAERLSRIQFETDTLERARPSSSQRVFAEHRKCSEGAPRSTGIVMRRSAIVGHTLTGSRVESELSVSENSWTSRDATRHYEKEVRMRVRVSVPPATGAAAPARLALPPALLSSPSASASSLSSSPKSPHARFQTPCIGRESASSRAAFGQRSATWCLSSATGIVAPIAWRCISWVVTSSQFGREALGLCSRGSRGYHRVLRHSCWSLPRSARRPVCGPCSLVSRRLPGVHARGRRPLHDGRVLTRPRRYTVSRSCSWTLTAA